MGLPANALCDYRSTNLRQRTCSSINRNDASSWCLKCTHRADHKYGKHSVDRHGPEGDCPLCAKELAI
jgi:hypothetical protein